MKIKVEKFNLPSMERIDLTDVDLSGGISVFLPAYNEEENIERAVRTSVEVLSSITDNYEVLVIDDCSTDRTPQIAEALARENPKVKVIHHQKNTRLGGAIRTGFSKTSKRYVFYCDADNPVDMWDVKRALPLMAKYHIVTGFRINREENLKRKIYSKVYNWLVGTLFGFQISDINFSFKLINREVLSKIQLHSNGGFIDVEFIAEALRNGFLITQVGVKYYPRIAGVSTMASIPVILEIFREMWEYIKRRRKMS
jgi:glycosyltransferase involved in cell wall biosynthesis